MGAEVESYRDDAVGILSEISPDVYWVSEVSEPQPGSSPKGESHLLFPRIFPPNKHWLGMEHSGTVWNEFGGISRVFASL